MIVVAVQVPPPPPNPGQLARDGKVEGGRRFGALSGSESRSSTSKQVVHTVERRPGREDRAGAASLVVRTNLRLHTYLPTYLPT